MSSATNNNLTLFDLPENALYMIADNLGSSELTQLGSTCQRLQGITKIITAWRSITEKTHCPKDEEARRQVVEFIQDLKNWVTQGPNPNGIDIAFNGPLTIERIRHLQTFCQARDTLEVWKACAQAIGQTVPGLDEIQTSDHVINLASGFGAWCSWCSHQSALDTVTHLDLSNKKLRSLPPQIGNFTALVSLNLENNQLTSFPPEFGKLIALETLNLCGNPLTSPPPVFAKLTALKNLHLNQRRLPPSPIGTNVQSLHSTDTPFTSPSRSFQERKLGRPFFCAAFAVGIAALAIFSQCYGERN